MKTYIYTIAKETYRANQGTTEVLANIYRIKNNIPILIDSVEWYTHSFSGEENEVLQQLVKSKELPKRFSKSFYNYRNTEIKIIKV